MDRVTITKCKVINFETLQDRMDYIPKEMEKIGAVWERYLATNPEGVTNPNIGNSYSHWDALRGESGNVLICEDDVVFLTNAAPYLGLSLRQLPEDWDILYLGCNLKWTAFRHSENLFKIKQWAHCTHALLYSEKGREYVLENYKPLTDKWGVYDNWLAVEGQKVMNCYVCSPMIAFQRACYSNIRKGYMDYYIEMRSNEVGHTAG